MNIAFLSTTYIQRLPGRSALFVILLLTSCFVMLSSMRAVTPPPDGGYPGGNTAGGQDALFSLTTGTYNTAIGLYSLRNDTNGSFNTGVGAGTLFTNTGGNNTAIGAGALLSNSTGGNNTATGESALFFNTTGGNNTAVGGQALIRNTTGANNTATGESALVNNTIGNFNTAAGGHTLEDNTTGITNVAVGYHALEHNTTGNENSALGVEAGRDQTTGNGNVYIGRSVVGVPGETNKTYIRNINATGLAGTTVTVDLNTGLLGHATSSRRYKEDIEPMDQSSKRLYLLKPVTFRYKKEIDHAQALSFGLIAEDVAQVNPDLIVRDSDGKPETVRYEAVNAMLLNEFLKEHKTVQDQGATIAGLQKQIKALTAGIHKLSAQVDSSKPTAQLALKDQ